MGRTKTSVNAEGLTDKQRRFVVEYLVDYNGQRAAKAAGYGAPAVRACKLLRDLKVKKVLAALEKRRVQRCEVRREEVLEQLRRGVTRDSRDLFDADGTLILSHRLIRGKVKGKTIHDLPPEVTSLIDGVKQKTRRYTTEDGIEVVEVETELKFASKAVFIDMAMKYRGLFAPEKHEHAHLTLDLNQLHQSQEHEKDEATLRLEQETLLCKPASESAVSPDGSNGSRSRSRPSETNGSSPR